MQELEKILEEIDETIERYGENPYIDGKVTDLCYGLNIAKDIIRKHMNDGWIPVEERLPERSETRTLESYEVTLFRDQSCIVATAVYDHAEKKWLTKSKVIAWHPLPEPYRLERRI